MNLEQNNFLVTFFMIQKYRQQSSLTSVTQHVCQLEQCLQGDEVLSVVQLTHLIQLCFPSRKVVLFVENAMYY